MSFRCRPSDCGNASRSQNLNRIPKLTVKPGDCTELRAGFLICPTGSGFRTPNGTITQLPLSDITSFENHINENSHMRSAETGSVCCRPSVGCGVQYIVFSVLAPERNSDDSFPDYLEKFLNALETFLARSFDLIQFNCEDDPNIERSVLLPAITSADIAEYLKNSNRDIIHWDGSKGSDPQGIFKQPARKIGLASLAEIILECGHGSPLNFEKIMVDLLKKTASDNPYLNEICLVSLSEPDAADYQRELDKKPALPE